MKIAIICPIGNLNRFGYWRTAQICLESWQTVGDLFLIHSSRTAIPFSIHCNYLREAGTLMGMSGDTERFDHRLVAHNANVGIEAARQQGYDVALTICVNWYVELEQAQAISAKCQTMRDSLSHYGFLYRRFQIGAQLFDSDLKSIAMLDLHKVTGDVVRVLVDLVDIDGQLINSARSNYADKHHEAYTDCEFELTLDEMQEKLLDIRGYEDILPKRRGADWAYWQRYYRDRMNHLKPSFDPLGETGRLIAASHPRQAFGDWVINEREAMA